MNIIILTEKDRRDDDRYVVNDHRAEHIKTILKLQKADSLEIGILNGPRGTGIIEHLDDNGVLIRTENMHEHTHAGPEIDIICALPRPQTLKKVLITCGMMHVKGLFLIRANRVEKSYYHSPLLNPENYEAFLIEGLSQGKLTRMPQVQIFERFKPFFEDEFPGIENLTGEPGLKLLPDSETKSNLNNVLTANTPHVILAIGPEGGWVPFEVEFMQNLGFKTFSLGPWVLRVEHALTAALAQIETILSINNMHK